MILDETAVLPLTRWENFYVIVGSSAGALTGLQFVVIALIADVEGIGGMLEIRAFGTPNVVHFCAALLISALASAPWSTLGGAALSFGLCGVAGLCYVISVIRHARRQTSYRPDFGDWAWYVGLPLLAYLVLAVAAFLLPAHPTWALFVVAATALLLLFIGIHNAWDTITYIAIGRREAKKDQS